MIINTVHFLLAFIDWCPTICMCGTPNYTNITQKVRQCVCVGVIILSTFYGVVYIKWGGWIENIQLHSLDVVE
jgi:hypothetical protein